MWIKTSVAVWGMGVVFWAPDAAFGQTVPSTFRSQTIAVTGEPAPGTMGAIFDRFGLFPGVGGGELRPHIDDRGNVAFHAFLGDGNPATAPTSDGIWKHESSVELVVLRNDPAPGTSSTFAGFPSLLVPMDPDLHAGAATFAGGLSSGELGIWSERFGALSRVLLTTDTLPDTPAGSTVFQFAHATRGDSILINVRYALAGAGSVGTDTEGLWVDATGSFQTVAAQGMPAPGTAPGVVFDSGTSLAFFGPIDAWDANRTGLVVFDGYLGGPGIDTLNDEGIWLGSAGNLALLFREGDSIPGQPSNVRFGSATGFRAFGRGGEMVPPTVNDRGTVLFGAVMRGPNFDHILPAFILRNGQFQILARASSSLPGTPPGDPAAGFPSPFTYARFVFGTVNNAEDVVLVGSATAGGSPLDAVPAIWRDRGAGLELVAGVGRQVPVFPANTFAEVGFLGFGDLGLLYYSGRMAGPGVAPTNDEAVFVMDAQGAHVLVLREGDPFDLSGNGTDIRLIADITGGNGVSDAGGKVLTLEFADGALAIVKVVPELGLVADARLISAAVGGTAIFHLDAGVARAGRPYIVGGSASGIHPGIDLGAGLVVPLNFDSVTLLTLSGAPQFMSFAGLLDAAGSATAGLTTFGPLPAAVAGLTVHFAYVVLSPLDFASNAVPITIVP